MDDFEQSITICFVSNYAWKEPRVNFTRDNFLWFNSPLDGVVLDGELVEDCLWNPGFQVKYEDSGIILGVSKTFEEASVKSMKKIS